MFAQHRVLVSSGSYPEEGGLPHNSPWQRVEYAIWFVAAPNVFGQYLRLNSEKYAPLYGSEKKHTRSQVQADKRECICSVLETWAGRVFSESSAARAVIVKINPAPTRNGCRLKGSKCQTLKRPALSHGSKTAREWISHRRPLGNTFTDGHVLNNAVRGKNAHFEGAPERNQLRKPVGPHKCWLLIPPKLWRAVYDTYDICGAFFGLKEGYWSTTVH